MAKDEAGGAKKWKAGDVVRLKSGGPVMTVGVVGPPPGNHPNTGPIVCQWFDPQQVLQSGQFSHEALDAATADPA